MKINWISNSNRIIKNSKELIDLEFALQKDLLKLLLKYPTLDCGDDFMCYAFNYNIDSNKLTISKTTPEPFYSKLKKVFKMNPHFSELFNHEND